MTTYTTLRSITAPPERILVAVCVATGVEKSKLIVYGKSFINTQRVNTKYLADGPQQASRDVMIWHEQK